MKDKKSPIKVLAVSPELHLVGSASTFQEVLPLVEMLQPDVLLTNVVLPDGSGAEVCREVTEKYPGTDVVFLSLHEEKAAVYSAVLAGGSGFILKRSVPEMLVSAIEMVVDGQSIFEHTTFREAPNWRVQPIEPLEELGWDLSPQQA